MNEELNKELNVLWRKGDGEMPERVKRIVDEAGDELLLRSLQLPVEAVDSLGFLPFYERDVSIVCCPDICMAEQLGDHLNVNASLK